MTQNGEEDMLNINTDRLIEEIRAANSFEPPEMNTGVKYLYEKLYLPMAQDTTVKLSELDFDMFEDEDVCEIADLYDKYIEPISYNTERIIVTLNKLQPAKISTKYI
jgi:hypothetical protein